MTPDDVAAQIDALLLQHQQMRTRSKTRDLSDLHEEAQALATRLRAAIERLAPGPNPYMAEMRARMNDKNNNTGRRITVYIGILNALRDDVAAGWVQGISELLHGSMFADLLDQASELVSKNYKDAAAVITGSAIETHIRLLCDKAGVATTVQAGQPKKADTMNADLTKANVYNTLEQKAVTAWLGIRNAAAHGECAKYTTPQVVTMISGVRDFMNRYPA